MTPHEKAVILAFVDHLRENGHPCLQVDDWPDERERNKPSPDAAAGRFVIEHTSMNTIANQRRDLAKFQHLTDPLKHEFEGEVPYRLVIALPLDHVARLDGRGLTRVQGALRAWIANESPKLPDATRVTKCAAPGIPFPFYVQKDSRRPPCLRLGPGVGDVDPAVQELQDLLARKVKKLADFLHLDKITVLLVESDDFALMNDARATQMIGGALGWSLPAGLDQVWFADTSLPGAYSFLSLTEKHGRRGDGAGVALTRSAWPAGRASVALA